MRLKKVVQAAFMVFCSHISIAQADVITIVADEWCPYNCVPGSDKPGYMIEIAKHIFESQGHSISYLVLPWTRAIAQTRKGQYSAIVGATRGDAEGFIFPDIAQGLLKNSFFIRSDNAWRYTGPQSLKDMHVGLIRDYDYGQVLSNILEFGIAVETTGLTPLKLNINMLMADRIDALVEDPNVAHSTISAMGLGDQIMLAGSDSEKIDLYIAFSPHLENSERYAKILSDGMAKIRSNGQLAEILEQYGLEDWD